MRYSLISRDWIADCVEIMHQAYFAVSCYKIKLIFLYRMQLSHWVDVIKQVIIKPHLQLTNHSYIVPGVVMPIGRLDAVGISLYGGTILPGKCKGRPSVAWDAQTVMEAIGSYGAGLIDMEELHTIECHALPGSGSCGNTLQYIILYIVIIIGGMFTANTMSSAIEALGMSPPGINTV